MPDRDRLESYLVSLLEELELGEATLELDGVVVEVVCVLEA
jgi:hypothetical protein